MALSSPLLWRADCGRLADGGYVDAAVVDRRQPVRAAFVGLLVFLMVSRHLATRGGIAEECREPVDLAGFSLLITDRVGDPVAYMIQPPAMLAEEPRQGGMPGREREPEALDQGHRSPRPDPR